MAWGALFVDNGGTAWATTDNPPMQLVNKQTIGFGNYTNSAQVGGPINGVTLYTLVFDRSGVGGRFVRAANGNMHVETNTIQGTSFYHEVTVYTFATPLASPVPFGINIFNSAGQCIQTNETKVMPAPTKIGDPNNPNFSGYTVSGSLPGRYVVLPEATGYISGVINSGQGPRPFGSQMSCTAYFDGANTHFMSAPWLPPPGGASGIAYANTRSQVSFIDVSQF